MQPNAATILASLPASMRSRLSVGGVVVDCYRGARTRGNVPDDYGTTRTDSLTAWAALAGLPIDWQTQKTAEIDGRVYQIIDAKLDTVEVFVRFELSKPLIDTDHP